MNPRSERRRTDPVEFPALAPGRVYYGTPRRQCGKVCIPGFILRRPIQRINEDWGVHRG